MCIKALAATHSYVHTNALFILIKWTCIQLYIDWQISKPFIYKINYLSALKVIDCNHTYISINNRLHMPHDSFLISISPYSIKIYFISTKCECMWNNFMFIFLFFLFFCSWVGDNRKCMSAWWENEHEKGTFKSHAGLFICFYWKYE